MPINKVGSKGIADGSVASADFADCTVSSDKLTDGTITNAKLVNSSVTLGGQSISLGGSGSVSATTDWQSVVTADGSSTTTAISGQGYFIDTTSASHTINLPVSASLGDYIEIKDYASTFGTNNVTVGRNGHKIKGVEQDITLTTNKTSLVLTYVDTTQGWLATNEQNVGDLQNAVFITATGGTETTDGDWKIHKFTGDGTFTVCTVGNPAGSDTVDYMVVAGGAGGGAGQSNPPGSGGNRRGGGGGAGGFRESVPAGGAWTASPKANPGGALSVSTTSYPITVGGAGSNSVFSTITSAAGGSGGSAPGNPGSSGGSGGGGATGSSIPGGSGGSGNTPPVSPPQGNPGGSIPFTGGGGGGGATAAGTPGGPPRVGPGGAGATTSISGTPTAYAGGGGGGSQYASSSGGSGGGGYGAADHDQPGARNAQAGSTNTGGGGGGGAGSSSSAGGGKGIVVIRYKYQ